MTILKVSLYIVIYLLNKSVRVGKCCVLREDIKSPQSATTPRVLTLKRSLACFEGIQRESPSYADARSIDMRMYTLQEVPKDLRAPSFRLERIGRRLSMTSLLEHIYISTFVDF